MSKDWCVEKTVESAVFFPMRLRPPSTALKGSVEKQSGSEAFAAGSTGETANDAKDNQCYGQETKESTKYPN